jgi:hypothetical protein
MKRTREPDRQFKFDVGTAAVLALVFLFVMLFLQAIGWFGHGVAGP